MQIIKYELGILKKSVYVTGKFLFLRPRENKKRMSWGKEKACPQNYGK